MTGSTRSRSIVSASGSVVALGAVLAALCLLPESAQATVIDSGPVNIAIPANGVSLDVVTGASGPSVPNPSVTFTGANYLALQDNGTIPPASGVTEPTNGGAYVGAGQRFYNLWAGYIEWGDSGYSDQSATAQIDSNRTWNFNSSNNLIGFRFVDELDGLVHYGWLRVSLGADATSASARSIVEYAYDDSPNTSSYAGVTSTASWDFDPNTGLAAHIQPMQHALNGFMPIVAESVPLPINDQAATLQANGTLLQEVDTLWARGIAPHVYTGENGGATDNGAVATALTLQQAGVPIHLFSSLGSAAFWPQTATPYPWVTATDGNVVPVFPLATPTAGYNTVLPHYQILKANGVTAIAGLWMDYEGWPAWYLAPQEQSTPYAKQYYTDAYAAGNGVTISYYGPTLLTNTTYGQSNPMEQYVGDLTYQLLKQSAYKALTDTYGPAPLFGNSFSVYSSAGIPFSTGCCYVPPTTRYTPEAGVVANTGAYADTFNLQNDFTGRNPANYPLNQTTADADYWYTMLTQISTSAANNGAVGRTIPLVSYFVPDSATQPYADSVMSVTVYKELLRHFWLRGAGGMRVFDTGPPYRPPQQAFNELEYVREVLDEMLSFRTFLVNGSPMSYAVNSTQFSGGVEWSGMSNSTTNPTQWVVRTVSRTGSPATVAAISPQPGLTFSNVPAPTDGATYILNADNTMHRVDSRAASLYLQFENGYQDSSGNNLAAVPGQSPGSQPGPVFSTNVPLTGAGVSSVLDGTYGLYAHQYNQYSIAINGTVTGNPITGETLAGNYVQVANTGNIFNAASFTVEAFVDIDPSSADYASVLSKGLSASPGAYDWQLLYRTLGQGLLELHFQLVNGATYVLRTSDTQQVLAPGWHHIAFTYDASTGTSSPTVTLYVDYVKWAWGVSTNRVLTGVLPGAMLRNTADDLVVGFFSLPIVATFDEMRFTPEVLDPAQMLTNAALQ